MKKETADKIILTVLSIIGICLIFKFVHWFIFAMLYLICSQGTELK